MFEKIKSKLLIFLVPNIIIIVILNYLFSLNVANNIISSEINDKFISIRNIKNVKIDKSLEDVTKSTKDLAVIIKETYQQTKEETYEVILKAMLSDNPNMLGIGVWFEPGVYIKDTKFVSIYAINKNGAIVIDDYYETDNYNYFGKTYYIEAIRSKKTILTDPYFDEQASKYIVTCATPMYDVDGSPLGVVAADIDLSGLPAILKNYNDDENRMYIINDDGVFIAHDDFSFVEETKNILDLENKEIVEVGKLALSEDEGITSFDENGEKYRVYFSALEDLNWKLLFVVSEESIMAPLNKINNYFILFGTMALISSIVILVQIIRKNIDEPINILVDEIELIANNNLDKPVDQSILKQNDEFTRVGKTLDTMKEQIRQYQSDLEHSLRVNKQNAFELELKNKELENKINEIEYLSFHDHLTGLNNRKLFELQLTEFNNKKYRPLHIIVSHVNSLKIINDSFGHEVGDAVLLEYVDVLRKSKLDTKLISRVSGNEFILMLPKKLTDDVTVFLEELSIECSLRKINGLELSVSFGVAVLDNEEQSIFEVLQIAEENMNHNKLYDEPGRREQTIRLINSTLQEKNPREQFHSERVSKLCEELAKAYGLPPMQQMIIKYAGLLHDIGKIGIPEDILNSRDKLTNEELAIISEHPEIGYRILSSAGNMDDISEMILSHHERCDGTGYPRRLKAEEIPLGAKIIAIADSFDAMVSDRSYRNGLPMEVAIEELLSCRGTKLDAELVDIFINKVLQN